MKKNLLTLLALSTLSLGLALDMNVTLSDAQAETYTLSLGPGALATITWPEPVTDVTVTRTGIVETKVVDNRVIIAGLTSNGNTPIQITTESGVRTWRIRMSSQQSGSIINVRVQPPAEQTAVTSEGATVTPAPVQATGVSAPTLNLSAQSGPVTSEPLAPDDLPSMRFTASRDGDVVVVQYRLQAGRRGLSVDERQIVTSAGNVRPVLSTLNMPANDVRYGTFSVMGTANTKTLDIRWPYRVGTTAHTATQQLTLP